jgi:hypothetical protein
VLDLVARYRDPLLWAAFDLRTMLYASVELDVLHNCSRAQDTRSQTQLSWSVFTVCQYLGWVDVFRRGIQLIDLGHDVRSQRLFGHIHAVTRAFGSGHLDGEELLVLRSGRSARSWHSHPAPVTSQLTASLSRPSGDGWQMNRNSLAGSGPSGTASRSWPHWNRPAQSGSWCCRTGCRS